MTRNQKWGESQPKPQRQCLRLVIDPCSLKPIEKVPIKLKEISILFLMTCLGRLVQAHNPLFGTFLHGQVRTPDLVNQPLLCHKNIFDAKPSATARTMLFNTLFVAFFLSASAVDSHHLRGRRMSETKEASTYHLVVFEDLLHQEDGSFTSMEHVMAIPVVDGVETTKILPMDIPDEFLVENFAAVEAGDFYISVAGAAVDKDILVFSEETQYTVMDEIPFPRERKLSAIGTNSVAVLRVGLSSGTQVEYSAEKLRQHLFTKQVSLKKQMERCTNGDLILEDAGIHEVTVTGSIEDFSSPAELRNKALEVFAEHRGIQADSLADHVIVILPENDFPGFVGNAATGGWISTLNNQWALDVMVYMHEIGYVPKTR